MELQSLDRNQLKTLFLNINAEYLKTLNTPVSEYINDPQFLNLRKQLHEVMNELDNRRIMDPPILHENSPRGLDAGSFTRDTTYLADSE